jgi:eukaryotic-like serine/threonine-protein kinase
MTVGEKCLQYQLTEVVDRSLTGTLVRANHEQTGREVLVHRLDGILLSGGAISRESLLRSSKPLVRLRHANIASVTEVDEEGGIPFLVIGDPPGTTLPDWDSPQRAAGSAERVSVILGVAKGLLHAHQQGILHRDFRPGSVKVSASGAAKVRGFIPVRTKVSLQSLLKDEDFVPGSLDYLSPEHLTGLDLDFRSDIFSFGIVLYELLAGRHPFRAADDTGTANRVLSTDAEPIARLCPDLPDEVAEAVDKAVRKEPEDRQQSFKEVVGALSGALPALRQRRSAAPSLPAEDRTPAPAPTPAQAPTPASAPASAPAPTPASTPTPTQAPASAPTPAPLPAEPPTLKPASTPTPASTPAQASTPSPASTLKKPSSTGERIAGDLSRIRAAFAEPPPKPPAAGKKMVQRLTAGLPPNLKTSGPERQSRPAALTQPAKKPVPAEATRPETTRPETAAWETTAREATSPVVEKPRSKPTKTVTSPPAATSPVKEERKQPAKAAVVPDITLGAEQPGARRIWVPVAAGLAIVLAGSGFWYFGMRTAPTETPVPVVQSPVAAVTAPVQPSEPTGSTEDSAAAEQAPPEQPPAPPTPAPKPAPQTTQLIEKQAPLDPPKPVRPAPRPWTVPVQTAATGRPPSTSIISSEPPPIAGSGATSAGQVGNLAGQGLAVPPPPPAKPKPKIGGRVRAAKLVSQPPPSYPAAARSARIGGIVRLRAHVDERGRVASVTYLDGPRMLAQAAMSAVRRWRYEPATLNGVPVAVDTDVQVNFTIR